MAISRMQMNRQLRAGGGIMDIAPREKFGLGSKLKRAVRKIIPNEVADVASKAAPFVAPFNPLLAGGMAAIGGFDKSGSIGDSLKRGILTYGGGQAARYLGGAGFQQGVNPFAGADFSQGIMSGLGSLGSSPIGTSTGLKLGQYPIFGGPQAVPEGQYLPTDFAKETLPLEQATTGLTQGGGEVAKKTTTDLLKTLVSPQSTLGERGTALKDLGGKALKAVYTDKEGNLDKMAVAGTIAGVTSYIEAKKLAEEAGLVDDAEEYTEEMYNADKAKYAEKYGEYLTPEAFGLKDGGRIGLRDGMNYKFMELVDEDAEEEYYKKKADELDRKYNPQNYKDIIPKEKPLDQFMLNEIMGDKGMNTLSEDTRDKAMKMYAKRAYEKGQISEEEYREIMGFKVGGRVGYKDAGFTTVKDLDIKRDKSKVLVMDEDGSTKIMDKEIAKTLGLKIIADSFDTELIKKANGGRVKYAFGSPENTGRKEGITSITLSETTDDLDPSTDKPEGIETILDDKLSYYIPGFSSKDLSKLYKVLGKEGGKNVDFKNLHKVLSNPNDYPEAIIEIKEMLGIPGKKNGGRIQYAMGTEVPIRENQAGVSEMDFRQTGGFVPPIGVKERADDIPAMLSNNEFVFTADAVRAAGGGSVNKGAKKMYDLMKSLEGKVV